jgi:hypothetical protein
MQRALLGLTINEPYRDYWRATKGAARHAINFPKHEQNLNIVEDMTATLDFISGRLRRSEAFIHHEQSEQQILLSHGILADSIEDLRSELSQTSVWAHRLVDREKRTYELTKEFREVDQSFRTYWLTTLAAIFLPLSLATSVLSMQTRLAQLHFLLYDFFGVAVIIGSVVLLVSPAMRLFFTWRSWRSREKLVEELRRPPKDGNIDQTHVKKKEWVDTVTNFSPTLILYLFWMLLLSSFLVGMVVDVGLGLKILGYGVAAEMGVVILTLFIALVPILWVVFSFITNFGGFGFAARNLRRRKHRLRKSEV